MNKFFFCIIIFVLIFIINYPVSTTAYVSGSPGGKTNSPLDGNTCNGCHAGNLNSGPGSFNISSDIPINGYVPGETYTITVQGSHPSYNKYGFELTAENSIEKIGEFNIINSSQTKLTNNNSVTHKITGTLGSATKSWNVDWTAPNSGSGPVKFYAAGMNANGNNTNSGDQVHTTSYTVNEENTVSLNNLNEKYKVFVNSDNIIIEGSLDLKKISISNINGQTIYNDINISLPKKINTSIFKSGIYIISYMDKNDNIYNKKISIN